MVYPRKYYDRLTTAVNIERKKSQILEALGIEKSYALSFGSDFLIRDRVESGKATSEVLSLWKDLQEMGLYDLKEYIRLQDKAQQTITHLRESVKEEEEKKNESLYVYDQATEERGFITREKYELDPDRYAILKKPVQEEDDS
jgi:hypothetical protein